MKTKLVNYINNNEHDNVLIRLEDWNEDYSFIEPFSYVVAYPISKKTQWFIKENKPFRLEMSFKDEQSAVNALNDLVSNNKTFKDYLGNIKREQRELI